MPTLKRIGGLQHIGSVCLLLGLLCASVQGAPACGVVVNPQVSAQSLSRNALRALFGMRLRTWPDGSPVTVFVLRDEAPQHIIFSKESLNIFPHQLRLAWDRLVFSGTGQAPTQVGSEQEMRFKIAHTRGAIGYLTEDMIDASVRLLPIY